MAVTRAKVRRWMLTDCSGRAAALEVEAGKLREGSGGSTPAVAETAVTAAGELRERRQWELGTSGLAAAELELRQGFAWNSGHGWEGENVKWHFSLPPPLFI